MRFNLLFFFTLFGPVVNDKTGIIKGVVIESGGKKPVELATVVIEGTSIGAPSDENGKFVIDLSLIHI